MWKPSATDIKLLRRAASQPEHYREGESAISIRAFDVFVDSLKSLERSGYLRLNAVKDWNGDGKYVAVHVEVLDGGRLILDQPSD